MRSPTRMRNGRCWHWRGSSPPARRASTYDHDSAQPATATTRLRAIASPARGEVSRARPSECTVYQHSRRGERSAARAATGPRASVVISARSRRACARARPHAKDRSLPPDACALLLGLGGRSRSPRADARSRWRPVVVDRERRAPPRQDHAGRGLRPMRVSADDPRQPLRRVVLELAQTRGPR